MNRKKYKRVGIVLVCLAILQFIVFGCIVKTMTGAEWLWTVSQIVMCGLLSGGVGMIYKAKNDKRFKKMMIEEKDERNKLINLKAYAVTLTVVIFCYIGVMVYVLSMEPLDGTLLNVLSIPIAAGFLAYLFSMFYYDKRI